MYVRKIHHPGAWEPYLSPRQTVWIRQLINGGKQFLFQLPNALEKE